MILSTLLAVATLSAGPSCPFPADGTSPQTAEGIEILRRLLVDELERAFEAPSKVDEQERPSGVYSLHQRVEISGMVTRLWAGNRTVEHSRAFHVPSVGLFLALDASLPVVAKTAEDEPARAPDTTDDEWDRIRREVRGDLTITGQGFHLRRQLLGRQERGEIDPQAIEKVVDLVLRTLARHAARVEGLAPKDSITVALRLSGRSRSLWRDDSRDAGLGTLFGFDQAEGEETPGANDNALAFVLADGPSAPEQNLVIRIGLADLARETPERLRPLALVHVY